jgi:hypothetical protein
MKNSLKNVILSFLSLTVKKKENTFVSYFSLTHEENTFVSYFSLTHKENTLVSYFSLTHEGVTLKLLTSFVRFNI